MLCCIANRANGVCVCVLVCCCSCCPPFSVSLLTLFFSLFSPFLFLSQFLSGLIPPPPVLLPTPLVVPPTTLLASPLLPPPPLPPPLSTPPAYLLTATPPTISTAVPRASACPSLPAPCPPPSTTSRQGKGQSPPLPTFFHILPHPLLSVLPQPTQAASPRSLPAAWRPTRCKCI